eukprot:gene33333-43096_t
MSNMDGVDFTEIGESMLQLANAPAVLPQAEVQPLWDRDVGLLTPHPLVLQAFRTEVLPVSMAQAKLMMLASRCGLEELPEAISAVVAIDSLSSNRSEEILIPSCLPNETLGYDGSFLTSVSWLLAKVLQRPSSGSRGGIVFTVVANLSLGTSASPFVLGTTFFMAPAPVIVFVPLADFNPIDPSPPEGHLSGEKRPRSPVVDPSSPAESTRPPKGVYEGKDKDKNTHTCHHKDCMDRIKRVQLLLRVTSSAEVDRENCIPDLLFVAADYIGYVRTKVCTSGKSVVGNYETILAMGVSRSKDKMSDAILGVWTASDWSHLSVLMFAKADYLPPTSVWNPLVPSPMGTDALRLGLEGLQIFWALFWHVDFRWCLRPLIDALSNTLLHHFYWSQAAFVRARVEQLIVDFTTDVRCRSAPTKFPQLDMGTRAGCLRLLDAMIQSLITPPTELDYAEGRWDREPFTRFYRSEYGSIERGDAKPAVDRSTPSTKVATTATPPGATKGSGSVTVSSRDCGYHVLQLLGLSRSTGPVTCLTGTCGNSHRNLKAMTRTEALASLARWVGDEGCVPSSPFPPTTDPPRPARLTRTRPPPFHFEESRLSVGTQASTSDTVVPPHPSTDVPACPKDIRGGLHIRINLSSFPGAGLGAFPRAFTPVDTWIGSYFGHPHLRGTNTDYQLDWGGILVDAWVRGAVSCRAAYINDPLDEAIENVSFSRVGNAIHAVTVCDVTPQIEFGVAYGQDFWLERAPGLPAELFARARRRYELPGSREAWSAVESRRQVSLPPAPQSPCPLAPTQSISSSSATGGVATRGHTPTTRSVIAGGARVLRVVPPSTACGPFPVAKVIEPLASRPVFNLARLKDVDDLSGAADNVLERQVEAELVTQFHAVDELPTESEPAKVLALSAELSRWIHLLYPDVAATLQPSDITRTVQQAYDYSAEAKSLQDAVIWGADYSIPEELLHKDQLDFDQAGGLVQLVHARRAASASTRLSVERLARWTTSRNPDRHRLQRLATKGMPVFLDSTFVPNLGNPGPTLSAATLLVQPALQKMLVEQYCDQHQAIIVSKAAMVASGTPFHVSKLSWTPKHGKPQGRPITDCSSGGHGQSPLNSDSTKDTSDAVWGKIVHPGIERAACMILGFFEEACRKDPTVQWSDLRLWKMDLKGAYTLISFLPRDVPLVSVEIAPGLLMFFLAGVFGWTGTPAAFQVVTRVFQFELKRLLKSHFIMYVDDILGVCLARDALAETEMVTEFADGLMGPDSIAPDKTVIDTRLVFIGYDFDLATLQVYVSNRCLLRALYCYFDVDLSRSIRVPKLQQLASLASRYSAICQPILPFKRRLHAAYAGDIWCHTLDGPEQRAVFIVRALLVLCVLSEGSFSRTFASFQPSSASLVLNFDSSLSGIGVIYYERTDGAALLPLGGFTGSLTPFAFGDDSSFQNTCEFIGVVVALWGMKKLGLRHTHIELQGDSVAALSWAKLRRFRSSTVGNASLVYVMMLLHWDITISEVVHVPADDNWRADMLSRDRSWSDVVEAERHSSAPDEHYYRALDMNKVLNPEEVIALCNPARQLDTEEQFINLWKEVKHFLDSVE